MIISNEKMRVAFVDRDGVINEERHYVHQIEDFVLLGNAIEGLKALADQGFELIVVTNQAGIARGLYDEAVMHRLHSYMTRVLLEEGVHLRAIYYCPHHPQGTKPEWTVDCDCRKPKPGMLLRAAREFRCDLSNSILIGDKRSDIDAGRAAGLRHNVLVRSGHPLRAGDDHAADAVCSDLLAAAKWIAASDNTLKAST